MSNWSKIGPRTLTSAFASALARAERPDIANMLRAELGELAARVPTRRLPDLIVRLLLPFAPNLRGLAPLLGRQFALTTQKARRVLDFAPRPAATTIGDCGRSLVAATRI